MEKPIASKQICLTQTDVAILAGGLGTRIRPILGSVPKVLAPVGEGSFLDFLFHWLANFGARRVVLSLGHGAEAVAEHLAHHAFSDLEIVPIVEPDARGTAGAIRYVRPHLKSETVLVMNGDSFIDADLCDFVNQHRLNGHGVTLLCCQSDDAGRFGRIELASDGTVRAFHEKAPGGGPGPINAGIYAFSQHALDDLCARTGPSLERDFFATRGRGKLGAYLVEGTFIDIGTPKSLADAEYVLSRFLPK